MIYLSASSIKDFLSCERKYWYRRFASDKRATSVYADTGTVVHEAIEKHWNNKASGYALLNRTNYEIDYKKAKDSLDVFYLKFANTLDKKDLIEENFTIPYEKGVKIRGTFDRVTPNGIIYDWKTNKRLPIDLSTDPQFILYHHAYSLVYKRPPAAVYFASLVFGRLIKFKYDLAKKNILLQEIIPDMLEHIREDKFNPTGIYRFATCNNCFFKEHCHQYYGLEKSDELDSTEFNFG